MDNSAPKCPEPGRKRKTQDGYILVKWPEHPRAHKDGYVFEHILVLEEKLGRPLRPEEISHHRNGIRSVNRPENLEPTTLRAHLNLHRGRVTIDLDQLRLAIRDMNRKQELYRVLRDELSALGYWKQQKRGKPFDGSY